MSPLRVGGSRPSPLGVVSVQDVGGGLNLKSSRYAIPPNQAVVLENWILVEDGSIIGRKGTLRWNSASLGAGKVDGAVRAYVGASNHFLATHAGTVYKGDDVTKTFASSLTGLTSGSKSWYWQYLTFVYLSTAAADQPKKWDGTSWSNMGISAPSGTPAGAAGGAGTPNGTYSIKFTFVTATAESNPSPKSADFVLTNQKGSVSSIAVGPAGTTKRKIYGFKNGVSSVYQLIGEINDNVTTSVVDFITTDQPSWTTTVTSDNDPPVAGAWITVLFKNRLWKAGDAANPTRLYFSQIFLPEAWPLTFFVDVPFDLGDRISALFVLGDLLLVFSDNALFYVIGDTPFSFLLKRSFAQAGCPSPWGVDRVENQAFFGSRFAFYLFDGSQSNVASDSIEPQFTGIFPGLDAINYAQADRLTVRYHDKLKAMACSFPTGISTTHDKTYWYFLRRQGWVRDSRSTALLVAANGRGDDGSIFAFDATDGILRQWDVNYTDDGTAITARYQSGTFQGDNPLSTKSWRWFTLRARPANAMVNVDAYADHGVENDAFVVDLNRGSVYGTGTYGTSTYAADFDDFEERFAANMKSRGIAIRLTVSYTVLLQVSQILLTYAPVGTSRRRVGLV